LTPPRVDGMRDWPGFRRVASLARCGRLALFLRTSSPQFLDTTCRRFVSQTSRCPTKACISVVENLLICRSPLLGSDQTFKTVRRGYGTWNVPATLAYSLHARIWTSGQRSQKTRLSRGGQSSWHTGTLWQTEQKSGTGESTRRAPHLPVVKHRAQGLHERVRCAFQPFSIAWQIPLDVIRPDCESIGGLR